MVSSCRLARDDDETGRVFKVMWRIDTRWTFTDFFLFLIIFIPKLISILLDVLFQYLDSKLGTIEFGAIGYGVELCRGSNEQGLYGR